MGTGWRRAFCTTISRNSTDTPPKTTTGMFKSSSSSSSTPRLRSNNDDDDASRLPKIKNHKNNNEDGFHSSSVIDNLNITPRLRCKTKTKIFQSSNPSSPRSPFSIFKAFSRSNCGLCLQSVKSGHKTAIFTAECSHTYHFPCISQHVKTQNNAAPLLCPVCKSTWKDASFLSIQSQSNQKKSIQNTSPHNFIKLKPYDDDEPLQTPRAGTGIIPIPEAVDEEDIDCDEEFKGFFTNPIVSSSAAADERDFKNVEVMLIPDVALISSNQTHETYALVFKVKAPTSQPQLNQSRRAPIDLVAVLDVNATMGGPKLQMLKRAMRLVISSLGSADRLSIIAFSASPKRLLPLRRMNPRGQRSARRIIDQLGVTQGSCAGEALKKATKVLEDRRQRNPVASIILLSDGHEEHVNENNQRQPCSHVSSTRFAHVEIPLHTLDKTHNLDPEENAFTKCVAGLLSVVAQDLKIQLGVAPGSDPAEITAVYSCNGKPMVLNSGSVRFGDLYAEEEREVLVEMKVLKSNTGSHHVLSARCCYNDPATQEVIYGGEKALLVPRAQASNSPKIQRLRNLFIATRAVAESRLLVEHNKLTTAHHLLSSARGLLMQSSSAEDFVKGLESELVDVQYQQQQQQQEGEMVDENGEPLTPTSAWRAAEKLAKVAVMKKSLNRVSDLHGFENARF